MAIAPADLQRWQAMADVLLPGTTVGAGHVVQNGESHEVLVIPEVGVIRTARSEQAAALMPRRLGLLAGLNSLRLPFRIPIPLSDAEVVDGITACALSWIPGVPRERRSGGADELRRLLVSLRTVGIGPLVRYLDVPHAYAGRERWARLLLEEVVPRLPADVRAESVSRVEKALALPAVPGVLVHGDLAGANLYWHADGSLAGVLDWDLASAFDPAVDAACLAWFGWETVEAIVDARTFRRARTWFATFGIEQVTAAVLDRRPEHDIEAAVVRAAQWVRRTSL